MTIASKLSEKYKSTPDALDKEHISVYSKWRDDTVVSHFEKTKEPLVYPTKDTSLIGLLRKDGFVVDCHWEQKPLTLWRGKLLGICISLPVEV